MRHRRHEVRKRIYLRIDICGAPDLVPVLVRTGGERQGCDFDPSLSGQVFINLDLIACGVGPFVEGQHHLRSP